MIALDAALAVLVLGVVAVALLVDALSALAWLWGRR
jgi:hypothetical protein